MLDPANDPKRMGRSIGRVFQALSDGNWHTLDTLATTTGDSKKRVSSRIRDLRLLEYGSYTIDAQVENKTTQLWKYRLHIPANKQIVPINNVQAVAGPKPVGKPAPVAVNAAVNPPQGAVQFFNLQTWKSEFIPKNRVKTTTDTVSNKKVSRTIAVDDQSQTIPHLVTTE